MLWSFLKVVIFIAIAAALTFGAAMLLETPGEVRLAFAGREVTLAPLGFVIVMLLALAAFWILFRISGLIVAILRFFSGDETALSRYFDRNRERRGFEALTDALVALAGGETRLAQAKAAKAEKLLSRPELTRLVNAQAAELAGNGERALAYYKDMVGNERTRFVGLQGLMKAKLQAGDTETALKLAEKAFALKPRHAGAIDTLFDLQSNGADWTGAQRTLEAKIRAKALPRDVGRRRQAVLKLAEARQAEDEGESERARAAAVQAAQIAPAFVPAVALAARLDATAGRQREAGNLVRKAWKAHPHPDLAAAFATLAPDETPSERMKRYAQLTRMNPSHPENRMLAAELALAAEDFPEARRAIGDLAEMQPTMRALAIMAAIEKGSGAPDAVVRGWLAKALSAPRGEAWICGACNHIHGHWVPICEHCKGFDTLDWKAPAAGTDEQTGAAAMLPLIVGALTAGEAREDGEATDLQEGDAADPGAATATGAAEDSDARSAAGAA